MSKHQFAQHPNQRFSSFFYMLLYMCSRLANLLSVEHFLDKILKLKFGMKNLLNFILGGNITDKNGPLCRGVILLSDIRKDS